MELPVSDLRSLLGLEACGDNVWRSMAPDTNAGGEVFGGQYLALALEAAMLSAPGRTPHALSAFFLRGARAVDPVKYRVDHTREGRAFAHRRVTACQDEQEVFRAEISFHEPEDGQPSHTVSPPHAPKIETLRSHRQCVVERVDQLAPLVVRRAVNRAAIEMYFPDPNEGLGKPGTRPATLAWVRPVPPPEPGDAVGYFATLAYLTDACANFASRIMHAPHLHDGELSSVSLNHAIWFHAAPRPIEQVLYVVDSPFAGGGLGFNRGTLFDMKGQVLASVTQEALIRRRATGREHSSRT